MFPVRGDGRTMRGRGEGRLASHAAAWRVPLYPIPRLWATFLSVFDHLDIDFPSPCWEWPLILIEGYCHHKCQNCQQLIFTDSKQHFLPQLFPHCLLCTMYLLSAGVLVVVARYVDGRMLLFKFQYPIIQHNAQHFNLHISVTFGKIECRVRFK